MKPVRKKIAEAASEQLRPLQDRGWPLVVVLANPMGIALPLEPSEIISAMYGDLEGVGSFAEDGTPGKKPETAFCAGVRWSIVM